MGNILSNGSTIYRYNNLILRSPLAITLNPDAAMYYSVAAAYGTDTGAQVYMPLNGFNAVAPCSSTDITKLGYDCAQAYLAPNNVYQVWRTAASPSLGPETVFYQGSYATSAAQPLDTGEAFWQLAAYHFTLPGTATVTSATINYALGGVVECYGNASAKSTKNKTLWANASDKYFYMKLGVIGAVDGKTPATIIQTASFQDVDIWAATSSSGQGAQGYRDVWGKLWPSRITGRDGAIPTLTTPPTCTATATADQISNMNALRSFYIVGCANVTCTSSTSYRPMYIPSTGGGWWGCASIWGFSLKLTIE